MLLANFIFVVSHLKMYPSVHLNTLKALTSLQSKRKELWHSQNSLFRHIEGHSAIVSHVQAY